MTHEQFAAIKHALCVAGWCIIPLFYVGALLRSSVQQLGLCESRVMSMPRRGGRRSGMSVRMKGGAGWSAINERASQQFTVAAEAGARSAAEMVRSNGRGGTWGLGIRIVGGCRLYAAQRRSQRILPGGADTMTGAAYVLGGLIDGEVRSLLRICTPSVPRDSRRKAVERALKERVWTEIVILNKTGPREARAVNLEAVRICDAVSDMLVAHSAHLMTADFAALRAATAEKDATIAALRAQLNSVTGAALTGPDKRPRGCWCGGRPPQGHLVSPHNAALMPPSTVAASLPLPIGVASHPSIAPSPPFVTGALPSCSYPMLPNNNGSTVQNIGHSIGAGNSGSGQLFMTGTGGYGAGGMGPPGPMDGYGGEQ